MVNWIRLSLWIGGTIFILSIISFFFHYIRARRKEKEEIEMRSKYPQQYPMPQQPVHQLGIPHSEGFQGGIIREQPPQYQYPQQQSQQYPQQQHPYPQQQPYFPPVEQLKPSTDESPALKKLSDFEERFNRMEMKIFDMISEKKSEPYKYPEPQPMGKTEPIVPKQPSKIEAETEPEPSQPTAEDLPTNMVKGSATFKITLPDGVADEVAVDVIKQSLDKAIVKNLKVLKKDLKKESIDVDIDYEIN